MRQLALTTGKGHMTWAEAPGDAPGTANRNGTILESAVEAQTSEQLDPGATAATHAPPACTTIPAEQGLSPHDPTVGVAWSSAQL